MFNPDGIGGTPVEKEGGGKVVSLAGERNKRNKGGKGPSPEYRYAEKVASSADLRIAGRENDSEEVDKTIYRWTGSHWSRQTSADSEGDALSYLAALYPDKATQNTAQSAVRTAETLCLHRGKTLLKKRQSGSSAEIYVPLPDAYLKLASDGTAMVIPPSRDLGLTYRVPGRLDLEKTPYGSLYQPGPVPAGSQFGKYLDLFFPDLEVRNLLQEAVGSSLLNVNFERGFFLFGTGANGKSTLLHLLTTLHPYHCPIRLHLLQEKMGLSRLPGKTLYLAPETPAYLGGVNEQILKELISRDVQESEKKYKDAISFRPVGTLFAAMNNAYRFSDHSHGLRRKVIQIPFSVRLNEDDPRMQKDFHLTVSEDPEQLQVFVDWALAGALRLLQQGGFSAEPEVVKSFAREQELQTDNVAAFLTEQEVKSSSLSFVSKDAFYSKYRSFCENQGNSKPDGAAQFFTRVNEWFRRQDKNFDKLDQRYLRGVEQGKARSLVIGLVANDLKPMMGS